MSLNKTARNKLIGAVHASCKSKGIDKESRHALQLRVTGKTSCADMNVSELLRVLDEINPENKNKAPDDGRKLVHGKIKALWLSLYYLGAVKSSHASALDAFVKRQTKIERLAWLPAGKASPVIEALKSIATREAGIDWSGWATVCDRRRVTIAIWDKLRDLGVMRTPGFTALDKYAKTMGLPDSFDNFSDDDWDRLIRRLGTMLLDTLGGGDRA